jgi:hypothetical protein
MTLRRHDDKGHGTLLLAPTSSCVLQWATQLAAGSTVRLMISTSVMQAQQGHVLWQAWRDVDLQLHSTELVVDSGSCATLAGMQGSYTGAHM